MDQDIAARVDALSALMEDMGTASGTQAVHIYTAIKALCAVLGSDAEDYATANIAMVLGEVEQHSAAMAGLMPSWDLPRDQHHAGALASIRKLTMPTCFGSR